MRQGSKHDAPSFSCLYKDIRVYPQRAVLRVPSFYLLCFCLLLSVISPFATLFAISGAPTCNDSRRTRQHGEAVRSTRASAPIFGSTGAPFKHTNGVVSGSGGRFSGKTRRSRRSGEGKIKPRVVKRSSSTPETHQTSRPARRDERQVLVRWHYYPGDWGGGREAFGLSLEYGGIPSPYLTASLSSTSSK